MAVAYRPEGTPGPTELVVCTTTGKETRWSGLQDSPMALGKFTSIKGPSWPLSPVIVKPSHTLKWLEGCLEVGGSQAQGRNHLMIGPLGQCSPHLQWDMMDWENNSIWRSLPLWMSPQGMSLTRWLTSVGQMTSVRKAWGDLLPCLPVKLVEIIETNGHLKSLEMVLRENKTRIENSF